MSTVEQVLSQQRKNVDFSPQKISEFLYGKQFYQRLRTVLDSRPVIPFDFNLHNRGRLEVLKQSLRDIPISYNNTGNVMKDDVEMVYTLLNCHSQMPGSVHIGMFLKCIEIMGSQQQKEEYLKAGYNYQIHGCYAQTEIAHGSDVRSLMTTATFDQKTDSFIIDSPTSQAAKFWPGELGLYATHALIYANMIINGKKTGIQSFIVPIRDVKTMEPLPGVQVGDIGPKIGFFSKDNGYMLLDKVRIPRKNMLSRFTEVTPNGQILTKGDSKISYATMMQIRKYICSCYPKLYSSAITIATRYSMFRRQFKNSAKEEIKVIDYQLQKDKIISRVAEYFAVILAGNKISDLCVRMLKAAENNDFSLMPETHACLSVGKPLISEIVYDGMEICRKACGGHGFSHYSGLPTLINEYACHLTHEGQNTVLYLQVARYLLKSYQNYMTKKPLSESVKYIESFDFLTSKKCSFENTETIRMEDIRILFAQSVCYLLGVVSEKMMNKDQSVSATDVWNKDAGARLKQLAMHHGLYYIFNSFMEAIMVEKDEKVRQIATDLCLLFGCNMVISFTSPMIQGGFITSDQIKLFGDLKEKLLFKIRPILIGIVDGFGIPDRFIRSALISGNPYENFLKLARDNQLNHQRLPSVDIVKTIKEQIRNPDPKL